MNRKNIWLDDVHEIFFSLYYCNKIEQFSRCSLHPRYPRASLCICRTWTFLLSFHFVLVPVFFILTYWNKSFIESIRFHIKGKRLTCTSIILWEKSGGLACRMVIFGWLSLSWHGYRSVVRGDGLTMTKLETGDFFENMANSNIRSLLWTYEIL